MRILAMDAATAACSAALWRDGAIEARRASRMSRGQSEALLPMVHAVLDEARCSAGDLDGLAVTIGPGSFTGLRAALAAARGMAVATGLPLAGVTTFEALAAAAAALAAPDAACPVLAVIDSRRRDVYAQAFDSQGVPLGEGRALPPADLACLLPPGRVRLAGDGQDAAIPVLAAAGWSVEPTSVREPDAAIVACVAAPRLSVTPRPRVPSPLYLHPVEATLPAAGGRLRP